jgi:hypothetical protein
LGQAVEYDVNEDDEDFLASLNRLVPPQTTGRALTPEILESYIDFFEKTYLFSKGQTKLPVKEVLLRQHALQKCKLCDFSDADQAVLECRNCGVVVHPACYHNILYDMSRLTLLKEAKLRSAKNVSKSASKAKRSASVKSGNAADAATPSKSRGGAKQSASATKADKTPAKRASRAKAAATPKNESHMDVDESEVLETTASMDVDETGPIPAAMNSTDVYRTPFSDRVHDDGSWWCAKCSCDAPEKQACDMCGRATGALFPRFILDETGKPRILNRRRPFVPHNAQQQGKASSNSQDESGQETPGPAVPDPSSAAYTPLHIRPPRPDHNRRRGRRPRITHEKDSPDIIWFHDICARAKPRLYCHLVDPIHVEDEDELNIPASDDEEEEVIKSPKKPEVSDPGLEISSAKLPKKASAASAPNATPTKSRAAPSSKSSTSKTRGAKAVAAAPSVLMGDRGRSCRLCSGHTGACVMCSEPNCGKHFHAHCAEFFGLVIERDEPMVFKCREHSVTVEAMEEPLFHPLFQKLPEDELVGLYEELTAHDALVSQNRAQTFGSVNTPPVAPKPAVVGSPAANTKSSASAASGSSGSAGGKAVGGKFGKSPTPSFAIAREALLPLEPPIPLYIFNFWIIKRLAMGHELIPRLRVIKQDETRYQEFVDTVSDMEENLRRMVLLRQHMERIRMIVDLCKKREGLKKQQIDDLAELLEIPGIGEFTRAHALGSPSAAYMQAATPHKVRKLAHHATPRSSPAGAASGAASHSRGATPAHAGAHHTPHRTQSAKTASASKAAKYAAASPGTPARTAKVSASTLAATAGGGSAHKYARANALSSPIGSSPSTPAPPYVVATTAHTPGATVNAKLSATHTLQRAPNKTTTNSPSVSAKYVATASIPNKSGTPVAARAYPRAGTPLNSGGAAKTTIAKTSANALAASSDTAGTMSTAKTSGTAARTPKSAASVVQVARVVPSPGGTGLAAKTALSTPSHAKSTSIAANSKGGASASGTTATAFAATPTTSTTRTSTAKRTSANAAASPSGLATSKATIATNAVSASKNSNAKLSHASSPPNGTTPHRHVQAANHHSTPSRQSKLANANNREDNLEKKNANFTSEDELIDIEHVSPRGNILSQYSPTQTSPPARATRRSMNNMHLQNGDPGFCNLS